MCRSSRRRRSTRSGSSSRRWGANWSANNFTSHHPTRSIVRRASFAKFWREFSLCWRKSKTPGAGVFAFRQVLRRWCPSKHANTIERTDIVSFVERRRLSRFGGPIIRRICHLCKALHLCKSCRTYHRWMTAVANAPNDPSTPFAVSGNFAMRSHSACKRRYQPRRFFAHFQLIRHQEPFGANS